MEPEEMSEPHQEADCPHCEGEGWVIELAHDPRCEGDCDNRCCPVQVQEQCACVCHTEAA